MDISEKQRRLSLRAERDKTWKFFDLYSLLYNDDWLRAAHASVRRNAGSKTAGCDGIHMRDFDERREENLEALRQDLKAGTFEPCPVRRVYIHETKGDGRIKRRPLGVPTIRDRIVQEALRMILEPIFEADFSRHSYGFRPNRSTQDAIGYIALRLARGRAYSWVVEGDIKSFFDTIQHPKLMRCLKRRIRDKALLTLIWKFLRAGILEEGGWRHSLLGAPQGGIISPVLANIYLHELDRYMERYTEMPQGERRKRKRKGQPNFLYVRFVDDFVLLCDGTKDQAIAMRQELHEFCARELKLELSLEKTSVTQVMDGFEFLGFGMIKSRGQRGRCVPKIRIPERALKKVTFKTRRALSPATYKDSVNTKIVGLNRILRGWCHYYQYTSSPSYFFSKLDYEVFWSMAHWLGRKYKLSMPKVMRRFHKGHTFATKTQTLVMPSAFKAKRYQLKAPANPYTSPKADLSREEYFDLAEGWMGGERRKGQADLRERVYHRDGGLCGICGISVPWQEADLDHIKPYALFRRPEAANAPDNLWILHRAPCHREKTKRDLRVLSRVR